MSSRGGLRSFQSRLQLSSVMESDLIELTPLIESAEPRRFGERTARERHRTMALVLGLVDVACLVTALAVAHLLVSSPIPSQDYVIGAVVSSVMWLGVFWMFGLYDPYNLSGLEEMRRTLSAVAVGTVLVILLTFTFTSEPGGAWVGLMFITALVMEIGIRRLSRATVKNVNSRSRIALRTLVVGSGEDALDLIEQLEAPDSGFRPLGYVSLASPLVTIADRPLSEQVERLRSLFRGYDPDCIFVTSPTVDGAQLTATLQAARQEGLVVRLHTRLEGILPSRLSVQSVGNEGIALTIRPTRLSRPQLIAKRVMDVLIAGLALLVCAPFLLLIALAIKITSPGPVLFRQERVTEGGRVFRIFKFRTMRDDADRHAAEHEIDTSTPFFKLTEDPRLTTLGKWLRKLSIDEIPQLLNVIRGDLSLVGPRPLPADQVAANVDLLGPRHEVRAGITGWWQIQGRSDVTAEEAVRMDQFYIQNWSPLLDLYIMLRTFAVLFSRAGAY